MQYHEDCGDYMETKDITHILPAAPGEAALVVFEFGFSDDATLEDYASSVYLLPIIGWVALDSRIKFGMEPVFPSVHGQHEHAAIRLPDGRFVYGEVGPMSEHDMRMYFAKEIQLRCEGSRLRAKGKAAAA